MDKFTFYRNATFGLLAINLVLLALHIVPFISGPSNGPGDRMMRAVDQLELNEEQHERFNTSVEVHKARMKRINREQREILQKYFSGLTSDETNINPKLPQKYLALNEEKVTTTYQHFLDVKNILRPEQLQLYQNWVNETTRRILGSRREGPGAPRPGQKERRD